MSLVDTDEPTDPEADHYVEIVGGDIDVLDALRDYQVRMKAINAAALLLFAAVFAYLGGASPTLGGTLVSVICCAVFGVYGVKYVDEAACAIRSDYSCDECRKENQRWEVTE